jgi:hypothetical protein
MEEGKVFGQKSEKKLPQCNHWAFNQHPVWNGPCIPILHKLKAIIKFTPGPQGWISPIGVNLAPRGEICPLWVKFTPSFTPRGEHSLLFRRMEGRTENFTPRG